jgi:predicted HTH transcriptional regulator
MNIEELESKLEGGIETTSLDVKCACDWSVDSLAKDILAMSNLKDGGYIIIGVEDNTFNRQGITPEQKETYNIDIMRDQMAPYADPYVNFTVEYLKDENSKEYAVIKVLPFEEIPVICKKDSRDTKKGAIYYRNKDTRVNSGSVSNSYDMRDIIETATIKMMKRRIEAGFILSPSERESSFKKFSKELEGL